MLFAKCSSPNASVMKRYLFFTILCLWLGACKDEDNQGPKDYTSAEFIHVITTAQLKLYINYSGYDIDENEFKYNVSIYKVTYPTVYKGQTVQASGLVLLPNTTEAIGMVSFQHGTISLHADAPSKLLPDDPSSVIYAGLASPGFIAVIPDFLGFGASDEMLHPYYVEDASARTVVDMLKAAKAFAKDKNIEFNGDLSLAGYSEGGYVTMATHKSIEQNGLEGFNLLASYPAAGGFDVKGMQEYLFSQTTYNQPFYIAYVASSYQMNYDWTEPLTNFFDEPYASTIPGLFDGSKSGSQINSQLTTSIPNLINDDLIANIDTEAEYGYIRDAFNENSLTDWTPTITMHIYHGNADTTVPYENSVQTYEKLLANGTSSSVVQLHIMEGAEHSTGIEPYLEDVFPRLLESR
jgi:pimeloyl-ACP methyl ester carboxylesterase